MSISDTMGAAFAQVGDSDAKVAARSRFKGYGPGSRRRTRKAEVRQDEVLEQLKKLWVESKTDTFLLLFPVTTTYQSMLEHIKLSGLNYSSADIEKFSLVLSEFEGEKYFSKNSGLFLSALINNGSDNDYIVHTAHLENEISHLGFENTKNINVNGSVGNRLGNEMKGGSIVVEGDAGDYLGLFMTGGSVIVKGNAGMNVGEMKGGNITVEGDIENYVDERMIEDGSLIVKGNVLIKFKLTVYKGRNKVE